MAYKGEDGLEHVSKAHLTIVCDGMYRWAVWVIEVWVQFGSVWSWLPKPGSDPLATVNQLSAFNHSLNLPSLLSPPLGSPSVSATSASSYQTPPVPPLPSFLRPLTLRGPAPVLPS